jgi:DNA-binding response OmpR family regulator
MEDFGKMHILYVEDDAPSGRLLQSIAQAAGYDVHVVGTGREFLVALANEKPDVLIVDLHLPDVSGLDLVAKARQRLPDTPALVVPASNAVDDAVKAIQASAIDY